MAKKIVINKNKSAAKKGKGRKKTGIKRKPVKPIAKEEDEGASDEALVVDEADVTQEAEDPKGVESIALEKNELPEDDAKTRPVEVLDEEPNAPESLKEVAAKAVAAKAVAAKAVAAKAKVEEFVESDAETEPLPAAPDQSEETPMVSPEAPTQEAPEEPDPTEPQGEETEAAPAATPASEEVFRFYCIRCGQKLKVRLSSVGKTQPCPSCNAVIEVPQPLPEN